MAFHVDLRFQSAGNFRLSFGREIGITSETPGVFPV
jgi:hypothetical protein